MKYPYEPEVNAILDVARQAAKLHKIIPEFAPGDVIQHLHDPAADWAWSLIDIILDYEESQEKYTRLIRNYRRMFPRRKA